MNEELKKEIESTLSDLGRLFARRDHSELALQMVTMLTKCGILWTTAKHNYEGLLREQKKLLAKTRLASRLHLENINEATKSIKGTAQRVTDIMVESEVECDKNVQASQDAVMVAERLFDIVDKAIYEPVKTHCNILDSIIRNKK